MDVYWNVGEMMNTTMGGAGKVMRGVERDRRGKRPEKGVSCWKEKVSSV
jgi:hypothetical protein